jgi:hypothetical protein
MWASCFCLLPGILLGFNRPARTWPALVVLVLGIVPLGLILFPCNGRAQDFDKESYYRAVEYCRGDVARPVALSADKKILCFDGWIFRDTMDESRLKSLSENGLFVVRSFGGETAWAIAISDMLRDRRATVVVYDYCLSACASFFLVASFQTYVINGSLVAWHNGVSIMPVCTFLREPRDLGPRKLVRAPCPDLPSLWLDQYSDLVSMEKQFYSERTLDPSFEDPPESFYIRKILRTMYEGTGLDPDVAWTWNPRYLKSTFKANIYYEAYPQSQEEIDGMVARLHLRKVIYDP